MTEIKAIIKPQMLSKVMTALKSLPHFPGVTVSDCQGFGHGRGKGGKFSPTEQEVFSVDNKLLLIFCSDASCHELVQTIQEASHTGTRGDGVIVVTESLQSVQISTGKNNE